MKNIYAINCSPRKNGNTAIVLENALKGASDAGATTKLIHLCELNFSGCRSCFSCKRKDCPNPGRCAIQDDLTPILAEICDGDGLFIGTPVYFGGETGLCRNFIERLYFPVLSYDDPGVSLAPKKFPVAFVYTMNVPQEVMQKIGYPEKFRLLPEYAGRMFGNGLRPPVDNIAGHRTGQANSIFVCDTYQFSDYSQYCAGRFDAAHKAEMRQTQFPKDCEKAYQLGAEMAK